MIQGEVQVAGNPYGEPIPGQAAFMDFMQGCWTAVRAENNGAPNVYGTAARMYDHLAALTACALMPDASLPEREEFVSGVRQAMLQPEIFSRALYPGAEHAAKAMHNLGPLMFWTAGDMVGGRAADGEELEGSWEQLRRVVQSGVMRHIGQSPDVAVCGAEDKLARLPICFSWLQERGAQEIVVFEDKRENLEHVQRYVGALELPPKLHMVWVKQGKHGATDEETPSGMHSLRNIIDTPQLLESLQLERPGFLADYDGVFSNDDCRRFFQQRAVLSFLNGTGWLKEGLVFA